jgi:hypothetical protein
MAGGRPSKYSKKVAESICLLLSEGESLRRICEMESMPGRATVFRWLAEHEEFRDQYAQAKEQGALVWAEEILDIADDGQNDWMEQLDKDGNVQGYRLNGEAVQRSKLRVDSRKWLLSKLLPKKYGDKVQQEVSGPNGAPMEAKWTVEFVNATPQDKPKA